MYEQHWGLRRPVFRQTLEPGEFFEGPAQEEALARLHFVTHRGRRLGYVRGDEGIGKSLLLNVAERELRRQGRRCARIAALGSDARDLLWQTACAWGLGPEAGETGYALWRRIDTRLHEPRPGREAEVLLIDDLDEATNDAQLALVRLLQSEPAGRGGLVVIGSGRAELPGRATGRLAECVDLRIDLQAWTVGETADFVREELGRGGRTAEVFLQTAIERLHERSAGVPRQVKQLGELALAAGASLKLGRIGPETIDDVAAELVQTLV